MHGFCHASRARIAALFIVGLFVDTMPGVCSAAEPFVSVGDSYYAVIDNPKGKTVELVGPHPVEAAKKCEWPEHVDTLSIFVSESSIDGLLADPRVANVRRLIISGAPVTERTLQLIGEFDSLESLHLRSLGALPAECRTDLPESIASTPDFQELPLSALSGLPRLKMLLIEGYELPPAALKSVAALRTVTWLQIVAGNLSPSDLEILVQMRDLELLALQHNRISPDGLVHFKQLPALRKLNLSDNPMDDLNVEDLRYVERVTSLMLSRSGVESDVLELCRKAYPFVQIVEDDKIDPFSQGLGVTGSDPSRDRLHARCAYEVGMRGCRPGHPPEQEDVREDRIQGVLIGDHIAEITAIPYLVQLSGLEAIEAPAVRDIGESHASLLELLPGNDTLRRIDLAGTSLSDRALTWLPRVKKLNYLRLALNPITDAGVMESISKCKLEQLYLDRTFIGNDAVHALAGMQTLKWLYLEDCRIDDEAIPSLLKLHSLRACRSPAPTSVLRGERDCARLFRTRRSLKCRAV